MLHKYTNTLLKRIYRPVKPFVSPLLKKIKLEHLVGILIIIGFGGILINGWVVSATTRVGFWPWSSKAHSEMAIAWLEFGNEKKAKEEIKMADKFMIVKTGSNINRLKKAEEKVKEPEKIREEIKSWEKVIEEKPYFKDVLLRLSVLTFQIYEDKKAIKYFNQAEYLDPNDTEVLKIKKIIF